MNRFWNRFEYNRITFWNSNLNTLFIENYRTYYIYIIIKIDLQDLDICIYLLE